VPVETVARIWDRFLGGVRKGVSHFYLVRAVEMRFTSTVRLSLELWFGSLRYAFLADSVDVLDAVFGIDERAYVNPTGIRNPIQKIQPSFIGDVRINPVNGIGERLFERDEFHPLCAPMLENYIQRKHVEGTVMKQ